MKKNLNKRSQYFFGSEFECFCVFDYVVFGKNEINIFQTFLLFNRSNITEIYIHSAAGVCLSRETR